MLKSKKISALFLGGCLLTSAIFAGCNSQEKDSGGAEVSAKEAGDTKKGEEKEELPANFNLEGFPIVNDKVTLSMMGYKHPIQGPWENLDFFKTMEDMTNITFTFDTPPADAYQEKKNLAFASGEYPDVFFGANLSPQDEVKYGSGEKILIPLNDLIENYAPNIKKMFEEKPEIKKSITTPDGNIYALPNINEASIATTNCAWVNYEWLDNLGITELPTTVDSLYELLNRFKNEDPNGNGQKDEIPFSGTGGSDPLYPFNYYIAPAFGILNVDFYVDDNDKVQYGYMNQNYKEYMKYINKLYKEGLIDSEIFNMTDADLSAKGKSGMVGMALHAIPQLVFDCSSDVEKAAKYPALPALSSQYQPEQLSRKGTGLVRGTFAITDKCENPEAVIRWVDYLYSEEGSIYLHYGKEGNLWRFSENGLREYIIPEDGRGTEEKRGGEITPDCGTACPKWVRSETEGSWDDIQQQTRIKECDEKVFKFSQLAYPDTYFLPEEQKEIDIISTDIGKYTSESAAKFVTGQMDIETQYEEFVQTLEKMGVQKLIDIYQTSYDRWKNSK